MIVSIIGRGFVGKATSLLRHEHVTVWFYDILPELCEPLHLTIDQVNAQSDIIFVAVPTPMNVDGTCNTTIVESVLSRLHHPCIVLRSTLPVGFSDRFNCFFMPEFLTEDNWPSDFYHCPLWIFGVPQIDDTKQLDACQQNIKKLMTSAKNANKITSDNVLFCQNREAEMIKLVRNNFLSTKVVFFNHIFDLCRALNIDYNMVARGVGADTRIGLSHTRVNGKEYRGYGGTCFPKDTNSLFHIFQENNIKAPLLEANLYSNEYVYQSQKPWLSKYNRAITEFPGMVIVCIGLDKMLKKHIEHYLRQDDTTIVVGMDRFNLFQDLGHERYMFKHTNLCEKIFIPKCHRVVHYLHTNHDMLTTMKIWVNVLDFCRVYRLPLHLFIEKRQSQQIFIDSSNVLEHVTIEQIDFE